MAKILIADDEKNIREVLKKLLEKNNLKDIYQAEDGQRALEIIEDENIDLIISDINMPKLNGLELFEKVKNNNIPFIILTAFGTIEIAVNAIKNGVYDFISKPFNETELITTIQKALNEYKKNSTEIFFDYDIENIFFDSQNEQILKIKEDLNKIKSIKVNILLLGETGTGKGLLANMIHLLSSEKDKPFIKVNCAAIPENLIEAELFGYVKGSFTGAFIDKPGKFEIANGGTIFLDEIGELNVDLQAKLLSVIQDKEISRIGDTKPRKVDVRIISATNVNLNEAIKEKKFREDLYYRLNVIEIKLPSLRDRKNDIIKLAEFFIKKYANQFNLKNKTFTENAKEFILEYPWPGNIRELENIIQKIIILETDDEIKKETIEKYLSIPILENDSMFRQAEEEKIKREIELIKNALQKTNGNRTKAAEILGISRRTLLYRIKEYNLK